MKLKPPGNINCCALASLYDKHGRYIGSCPDLPVPIVNAIEANPNIHTIKVKYPMFPEEIKTAEYYKPWM